MAEEVLLTEEKELSHKVNYINDEDLPRLIHEQVDKLNDLDKSVRQAISAADNANKSASRARSKSAGFGKKKAAIESLQESGADLAKALESSTIAQKVSFEFQTKLAEISKYLFGLGASNIARNRSVIRELELTLKGASEEEVSHLAQQEILTVVKQLKDQEDILQKIAHLTSHTKEHDHILSQQADQNKHVNALLADQIDRDDYLEEKLERQEETATKHEIELKRQAEIHTQVEATLSKHEKYSDKISTELKELESVVNGNYERLVTLKMFVEHYVQQNDEEVDTIHKLIQNNINQIEAVEKQLSGKIQALKEAHEQALTKLTEDLAESDDLIAKQETQLKELKTQLEQQDEELTTKSSKTVAITSLVIGSLALVTSILHFFI